MTSNTLSLLLFASLLATLVLSAEVDTEVRSCDNNNCPECDCVKTCCGDIPPSVLPKFNNNTFGDSYYIEDPTDQIYLTSCCYKHFIYNSHVNSWEWVFDGSV